MATMGQIRKRSEIERDSPMKNTSQLERLDQQQTHTKTVSVWYTSISRRHREWSTGPRNPI